MACGIPADPSVLGFFLVNSVHTLIRLSPTFKGIYRKLMKRIGKNRAIIAIARKLAVAIFNMLSKNQHFVDDHAFKALYERKLKNMNQKEKGPMNSIWKKWKNNRGGLHSI